MTKRITYGQRSNGLPIWFSAAWIGSPLPTVRAMGALGFFRPQPTQSPKPPAETP